MPSGFATYSIPDSYKALQEKALNWTPKGR